MKKEILSVSMIILLSLTFLSNNLFSKTNKILPNEIACKSNDDNPLVFWLIKRVVKSYMKRQVKKHVKKGVKRHIANKAIDYGVDYVADNLNSREEEHIKSEWNFKNPGSNHARSCPVCSNVSERVIVEANDYIRNDSGVNRHKGTRINVGLSFIVPKDGNYKEFIESSDAFSGYSFGLEHNLGFVQFEGGYKYYQTTNDRYILEKYTDRGAFLNAAITYPRIKVISPYIGIGYSYNQIKIEESNETINFNNSAPYYFGGLDIQIGGRFYLYGRYSQSFKAKEFDYNLIEGGIKIILN